MPLICISFPSCVYFSLSGLLIENSLTMLIMLSCFVSSSVTALLYLCQFKLVYINIYAINYSNGYWKSFKLYQNGDGLIWNIFDKPVWLIPAMTASLRKAMSGESLFFFFFFVRFNYMLWRSVCRYLVLLSRLLVLDSIGIWMADWWEWRCCKKKIILAFEEKIFCLMRISKLECDLEYELSFLLIVCIVFRKLTILNHVCLRH